MGNSLKPGTSMRDILPPTIAQTQTITRMCIALHEPYPYEEKVKTMAEAGVLIRHLSEKLRQKPILAKVRKSGKPYLL